VAHALIGLLLSVTGWPGEALSSDGLEPLLAELTLGALSTLDLSVRSA
jgi:hypothetical protein